MREDIAAALRNAQERGELLEDAVETLVRAGYSRDEVVETSKAVNNTIFVDIKNAATIESLTAPKDTARNLLSPENPRKIILIILISLLVLAALGISAFLVFNYLL